MTPEQEIKLLKELLYCTKRSCNNCGKVNCENFQRQRIDCCGLWVSYKDYIKQQEEKIADLKANFDYVLEGKDLEIKELKEQIKEMKNCLGEWFKYENERDYELNVDELLTETQQFLEKEIKENDIYRRNNGS